MGDRANILLLDNADEVRHPGAHPIYGGLNWGYSRSEHWGDWNVNHGYYGSHSIGPDGRRLFDGQPIPNDLALWTCDQPDQARARRRRHPCSPTAPSRST